MFWNNFVFYCNKKGVAPNVAATAVGVKSSGTVTGWKNGAAPRQGVLRKLADYFGVSTEDLLTGDSPGDKKERPAENGEALEKDLPEDIQQLLSICRQNPALASALLSVAKQIEKGQAGPGSGGKE